MILQFLVLRNIHKYKAYIVYMNLWWLNVVLIYTDRTVVERPHLPYGVKFLVKTTHAYFGTHVFF